MDDLDELKGRVERATRVLSEREAEEQGRHAQLIALVAALEAKSLEARRERQLAEHRLAAAEAENAELRGLLVGLLDAVEAGSRSRFADAIYALEERVGGLTAKASSESATQESGAPAGAATDAPKLESAPAAEPQQIANPLAEDDLDAFTANLAANCAVEEEIAEEAEERRVEAADDARMLLERIRRQVDLSDAAPASADDASARPSAEEPADEGTAEAAPPTASDSLAGFEDLDEEDGPLTEQPSEAADTLIEDAGVEEAEGEETGWGEKRKAVS